VTDVHRRQLASASGARERYNSASPRNMSVKSHVYRGIRSSTARLKEARGEFDRPRRAASLDAWLARDWSHAVHLTSLEEFQQIHVCTQNTLYELIVINQGGDVRVRGGRYFPEWTAARLAGCTAGGSFLKRLAINLGLQMEFECDRRRIVTSPVRTIALLQRSQTV
jgi:hypothetical protein